jgi:PAS domain-containing protein
MTMAAFSTMKAPSKISPSDGAEEALRDSEGRYRSVIASMEEGIVVQDANGFVLECNASAERILGVPADRDWQCTK